MRHAAAAAAALALLAAPAAWAHPFAESTDPPAYSGAPAGRSGVSVSYSEAVELSFSSLRVYGPDGSRVDDGPTEYAGGGEDALRVPTPPLPDGVYTVSSRVLSKVDGHLVDYAFSFSVGAARAPEAPAGAGPAEEVYLMEAAAAAPGFAGQAVVLGAAAASALVWGPCRARAGLAPDAGGYRGRLMALTGAGLAAVMASDVLVLAAYSARLGIPAAEALGTSFGAAWAARAAVTGAMVAAWFVMERRGSLSRAAHAPLVALGLVLVGTTTATGHGLAAAGPAGAAISYAHSLAASVWVGGVALLAFAVLPSLARAPGGDGAALAAIPRFSMAFTAALGAAAVTGPVLLWAVGGELAPLAGSAYGALLAAKLALAGGMVACGGYHQAVVLRRGLAARGAYPAVRRMARVARPEAALGVALLCAVALLANATLPAAGGEAAAEGPAGVSAARWSGDVRFEIGVWPAAPGPNRVEVSVSGPGGGPVAGLEGARARVSSPAGGIPPIEVPLEGPPGGPHSGVAALGFPGAWVLDVEALRSGAPNEAVSLHVDVRPDLARAAARAEEFPLPEGASPLYVAHGAGGAWASDPSAPRLWRLPDGGGPAEEFRYEGSGSVALDVEGGTVWFTDIGAGAAGALDPATGGVRLYPLPALPGPGGPAPVAMDAEGGSVWVSVVNRDALLRLDAASGGWEEIALPAGAAPFGVLADGGGGAWFAAQGPGALGRVGPGGNASLVPGLEVERPETVTEGPGGLLWVSEHAEGGGVAWYDPATGRSGGAPSPDPAALPNSVSFDRHGNAWFALHTVDGLAGHDPATGASAYAPLPEGSLAQFTSAGPDGRIWYAAQGRGALGAVEVSYPAAAAPPPPPGEGGPRYSEVAFPLGAAGAAAAGLFFARAARDARRADALP